MQVAADDDVQETGQAAKIWDLLQTQTGPLQLGVTGSDVSIAGLGAGGNRYPAATCVSRAGKNVAILPMVYGGLQALDVETQTVSCGTDSQAVGWTSHPRRWVPSSICGVNQSLPIGMHLSQTVSYSTLNRGLWGWCATRAGTLLQSTACQT